MLLISSNNHPKNPSKLEQIEGIKRAPSNKRKQGKDPFYALSKMSILLKSLTLLSLFFTYCLTQPSLFGNSRGTKTPLIAIYNGGDDTEYRGGWELVSENAGVSAMHMTIMPNTNKAIMFDAAGFGPSGISLPPGDCRRVFDERDGNEDQFELDCWAHAVEFNIDTADIRPLKVCTN